MGLLETFELQKSMDVLPFLGVLTVLQLWWIAVWGLAYMAIQALTGKSKFTEFWIYIGILFFSVAFITKRPHLLEKL